MTKPIFPKSFTVRILAIAMLARKVNPLEKTSALDNESMF